MEILGDIDLYDRITETYYYEKPGEKLMEQIRRQIHWICGHTDGEEILIVGCAHGIIPLLLGCEGKNVLGIDISQKAIDEANAALKKEEADVRDHVRLVRANFTKHDFGNRKFDTVIIAETPDHLVKPKKFVEKAARLLKKNSKLIVTAPFGIHNFIDHKKIYYFLDLYQLIIDRFELEDMEIFGKWIGMTARLRAETPSSETDAVPVSLIAKAEKAFYDIERNFIESNSKMRNALENADKKYRNTTDRIEKQKKQIVLMKEKTSELTHRLKQAENNILELEKSLDLQKEKNEKLESILRQKDEFEKQLGYKEASIERLQHELNEAKQALNEAVRYRKNFEGCRASASYRLGHLLIHEIRSIRDIVYFPKKFRQIIRDRIQNKTLTVNKTSIPVQLVEKGAVPERTTKKYDKSLSEMKIACVMDPFTYESYGYEANFMQLTPQNWKEEMSSFRPDMLFVESAWRGKDELWWNTVGKKCDELVAIVHHCNQNGIPTVFWNKEDPVHFGTFLETAKIFDFVFTTDIDMIGHYKEKLGHERVYLLPFACQPMVNNPLEKYKRKDAFCFAGAYYRRYPERTKDLDNFMRNLPAYRPIEIYDRNYGKDDPNYSFPEEFRPFIVGTLPFSEIDKAYKGYEYAINLNSVKQSQSMFARRVYEVLASNTLTVSNFSRALRLLFGDLVITSDSGKEIVKCLRRFGDNPTVMKKLKLAGLRKVMREHTYRERLGSVISTVFDWQYVPEPVRIFMVCFVQNEDEAKKCLVHFKRQNYPHKELLIIDKTGRFETREKNVTTVTVRKGMKVGDLCNANAFLALIDPVDYYGADYLTDLVLGTHYFHGDALGKAAYYRNETGEKNPVIVNENAVYRSTKVLELRRAIVKTARISAVEIKSLKSIARTDEFGTELTCISLDEFNYCEHGQSLPSEKRLFVDAPDRGFNGISLKKITDFSRNVTKSSRYSASEQLQMHSLAEKLPKKIVGVTVDIGKYVVLQSELPSEKHLNLYNQEYFAPSALGIENSRKVFFDAEGDLDLMMIVEYNDEKQQKISHQMLSAGRNGELTLPNRTKWIRFGYRVKGSGNARMRMLELGHRVLAPSVVIGNAKHLVLTNLYPSYDNLYRNGFVHSRVRAYRENGLAVDVFTLQKNAPVSFREFENIDVISGSQDALRNLLRHNRYKTILVHFLDSSMWEVIEEFLDEIRVIVWVHGAEIQPWHRRIFNYTSGEELEKAKEVSDRRLAFWREVLRSPHRHLKLVFVSKYFMEEVEENLGLRIPEANKTVIHNFIDTELFSYIPKDPEQRKKILSIRPYASRTYANDLSVKMILELSKKPYFNELEFRMIGDGILFEETLAPLRKFDNVIIEKRFLTQSEMALLFKAYGIFLCPSRMDTQGVSRGEAMSSGLVPVTNSVAAIPEFVDDNCALLSGKEDVAEMVRKMEEVISKPSLFSSLSESASKRVYMQCGVRNTIESEIKLIDL